MGLSGESKEEAPEIIILGVGFKTKYSHVHGNIIKKVEHCKVFWLFGLIRSTWFQLSNIFIGVYPHDTANYGLDENILMGIL